MSPSNWRRKLVFGPGLAIIGVFAGNSAIATAQEIAERPHFDWLPLVRLIAEVLVSAGGTTAGGWTLLSTVFRKREAFARGELVDRLARLESRFEGPVHRREDPVLAALEEMRGLLEGRQVSSGLSKDIDFVELKGKVVDLDNRLLFSNNNTQRALKAQDQRLDRMEAHMATQDQSLKELAKASGEAAQSVLDTKAGVDELLKRLPGPGLTPAPEPTTDLN